MSPPGEINYFFTVDTVPVKSWSSEGKNTYKKISSKNDFIKCTFEGDYIDDLKNIIEKLKYQKGQESEKKNNRTSSILNSTTN